MSKQKEIDVWVCPISLEAFERKEFHDLTVRDETFNSKRFKAKLIIEIPEKSVTITESQFDEIVKTAKVYNANTVNEYKEKLFS